MSLFDQTIEIHETNTNLEAFVSYGKVLTCKDGIIEIAGLRDVMAGEVVQLGNDQMGMISNLEKNSVSAIVLGDDTAIRQGDLVISTGSSLDVPVGDNLLGRVVRQELGELLRALEHARERAKLLNLAQIREGILKAEADQLLSRDKD